MIETPNIKKSDLTIYKVIEMIYDKYGNAPEGAQETVVEFYSRNRAYWFFTVKCLGKYIIDMETLTDLQSVIYGKRQEAVDAYHNLVSMISTMSEDYKKKVASSYEKIKTQKIPNTTVYLFSTDTAIRQQLDGMYSHEKYLIDIADNHAKYLEDTIRSIDDIIYAIPNRIRLEEIKLCL